MSNLGAGIVTDRRDDVRAIWAYLAESFIHIEEAILHLRRVEEKTAAMTGMHDLAIFAMIDTKKWINLCRFVPLAFVKELNLYERETRIMLGLSGREMLERHGADLGRIACERKEKLTARASLDSIVADLGLMPPANNEPEHVASTVAAFLAERVLQKAGWDMKKLNRDQEFVVMLVTFVACDHLSRVAGAKFEICTMLAPVIMFGAAKAQGIAGMLGGVGNEFNRLADHPQDSKIILTIGNAFAGWLDTRDDAEIERVAGVMGTLTRAHS